MNKVSEQLVAVGPGRCMRYDAFPGGSDVSGRTTESAADSFQSLFQQKALDFSSMSI